MASIVHTFFIVKTTIAFKTTAKQTSIQIDALLAINCNFS